MGFRIEDFEAMARVWGLGSQLLDLDLVLWSESLSCRGVDCLQLGSWVSVLQSWVEGVGSRVSKLGSGFPV